MKPILFILSLAFSICCFSQQEPVRLSVRFFKHHRSKLPANQQMAYQNVVDKKKAIVTVGDKWATVKAENFGQATQPLYVILNTDQQLMNHPMGYTPDANKYKQGLECGLNIRQKMIRPNIPGKEYLPVKTLRL